MINHPQLGDLIYDKIYFELDHPIMFSCHFGTSDDQYVGILVEDYDRDGLTGPINVLNYYFVGANSSEIKMMEKHNGKIREMFSTRPVWFLNYQYNDHGAKNNWFKEPTIEPSFEIVDELTLC